MDTIVIDSAQARLLQDARLNYHYALLNSRALRARYKNSDSAQVRAVGLSEFKALAELNQARVALGLPVFKPSASVVFDWEQFRRSLIVSLLEVRYALWLMKPYWSHVRRRCPE